VEDLLAERDITLTHEIVRQWCRKFGPPYADKFIKRRGRLAGLKGSGVFI
jgi:transposase-like protein